MAFEQSWRWFGPDDPISLEEIRQTGATGIVTALHQIPPGGEWTREAILERKRLITAAGLTWSVAESLPVHDDLKRRGPGAQRYLANYTASIRNLGACGVRTVCYNFMPVLDWSRTDLSAPFPDGSMTTAFSPHVLAAFDLCLLKRPGAREAYAPEVIAGAERYFASLGAAGEIHLLRTILLGFPGSGESYTVAQLRDAIEAYRGISAADLRANLQEFLRAVIPAAEESGVSLAIHPDDPPLPILGLPRIVSTADDLAALLAAVDSPANGITLCTGSLGASRRNDVAAIAERFAPRISFVHLRNVTTAADGSFLESDHLEGDVDLYRVIAALLLEQRRREREGRRDTRLPMRPDHGHLMSADAQRGYYPGYSLYGRMRGLAELRGLELGIRRSLQL